MSALEKLKQNQLCFVMECNGCARALRCGPLMEFEDYVLFVTSEIQNLGMNATETIKCLELFQIWILQHFGVVLDVFSQYEKDN